MKVALVVCALFCVAFSFTHKAHPCNFAESCGIHDMKRVDRASPDYIHTVKIHLRQNNFEDSCSSLLEAVSTPTSSTYGHYYSFEQIRELTWDEEAIHAVKLFLRQHHVPKHHTKLAPNGEFITVKAPISTLEKMFSSEFHVFKSVSRASTIVRAESYTVPSHVAPFITLINGIRNFPVYHKHAKIAGASINAGGSVTPQLIWKTYNLPNETDSTPLADQAVFEALGQSYSPDDLKQFQTQFNIPVQDIKQVIGPNDPSQCASNPNNCGEANLDVQYIMAMAQASPTIYWSIADESGDIFLDFIEEVAKDSTPPQVFSISYGGPEHLQNGEDMLRFNTEVCKMGLRGLTLFASSGDDGVAGYEARNDPSQCGFFPQYPANCPYLTIVGATMGPENGRPEVACQSDTGSIITSGGGFSNVFAAPRYQKQAVSKYLAGSNVPPTSMFNTTGRAYPDIASLGNAYVVVIGGNSYQVSGTSASAPVFCGMVTLVNGDREAQGKSTLGFLNPLLYSLDSSVFHDITSGNNKCCAGGQGSPVCCPNGFYCAPGWDPVTGRGSIDFTKFANILSGQK